MKLKNQIFLNDQFIQSVNKIASSRIPAISAFKLLKVIKVLEQENATFTTAKNNLIHKYGTPKENGSVAIDPSSENYQEFAKEFQEIIDLEFEIPGDDKITISASQIKDQENKDILFTVTELAVLSEIIELTD